MGVTGAQAVSEEGAAHLLHIRGHFFGSHVSPHGYPYFVYSEVHVYFTAAI